MARHSNRGYGNHYSAVGHHQSRAPFFPVVALSLVAIGLLVAIAVVAASKLNAPAVSESNDAVQSQVLDSSPSDVATPQTKTVKVTFAGDCTLGTDVNFDYGSSFNAAFENKDDPSWFLANVKPIFFQDDITVVNMEGTLTSSSDRQDKTFAFKGDADFAKVFSTSSVEAASMANNHSSDYGSQSYDDTLAAMQAEGIKTFGYDDIAYIDVNDVKVALIGTYELAKHEAIEESMVANIRKAQDDGAQLILVYMHWGIERDYVPNQTQISLGHAAIDAGADLVVGAHPHVIQGWEVYQDRYIVYSLGNFCFGGNSNPSDKDCMIFQQTFSVTGDDVAKDDDVEFIACSISSSSGYNNYQPTPATGSEKDRIDAKIQSSTDQISKMV